MPLDRAVAAVLEGCIQGAGDGGRSTWDAGPAVLAQLVHSLGPKRSLCATSMTDDTLDAVLQCWISQAAEQSRLSLYGGMAAAVFGLFLHKDRSPRWHHFHQRIRVALLQQLQQVAWPQQADDWHHYDLISGPSGLLLVLTQDDALSLEQLVPLAQHLAQMLLSEHLGAFKIKGCDGDPQRQWNYQAVNLGLAHGMGGPIAALTHWLRRFRTQAPHPILTLAQQALTQACQWLITQTHTDSLGLLTWPVKPFSTPATTAPGASRREAWCYGAPGLAWVLWDAGELLQLKPVQATAIEAFQRYAQAFNPQFHLDDEVDEQRAICHGSAGILLIADAFYRHAQLTCAQSLAQQLKTDLLARLSDMPALTQRNPSLLSGASGIVSALLTHKGADRQWLCALALR